MLPYWLFLLIPAFAALVFDPPILTRADRPRPFSVDGITILTILSLTVVVGFRYEVGGDWLNYFRYLAGSRSLTFSDLGTLEDPGYWALNLLSVRLGWGITGVNAFGALIFSIGLVLFCQNLPRPWLALACAIPYLVTVVGMGYTRQAIALGFVMIGFIMLGRKSLVSFALCVLAGALFHKSAIILLPVGGLTISKNRFLKWSLIVGATALGYITLLEDSASRFLNIYVDENIESSGAFIRLFMNAIPALIFIFYRKRFALAVEVKALWMAASLLAVAMFVAFFLTNLSTALDRMGLYIIPLQLVVFACLPDAFGAPGRRNTGIVVAILLFYAAVLFVWLNFASHSRFWVPYQMAI